MNGLCYMIPDDFTKANILKLPLMVNGEKQNLRTKDNITMYYYGYAGYGMAATYTDQVRPIKLSMFTCSLEYLNSFEVATSVIVLALINQLLRYLT